jgi:hypothetical protein
MSVSRLRTTGRTTTLSAWIAAAAAAFTMLSLAAATQVTALSGHSVPVSRRQPDTSRRSPGPPRQRGMAQPAALVLLSAAGAPARIHVLGPPQPFMASSILDVHTARAAPASSQPEPLRVPLSFLILPAGWVVVASSAVTELRGRRRELRTLRALGWARSYIRRRLLQEFALLAALSSLAAVLAAYGGDAVLGRTSPSWWELPAVPAAVVMMIAAAWWPVRQATAAADPMATVRVRLPADWTRRRPWMLGQAIRNLLHAPKRTSLRVLVIASSCGALGQQLATRWAFGGTLVTSWLGHLVSLQPDPIDTSVVIVTLVLAAVTVAELDWPTVRRQVLERQTLQAIGWSAGGVVRLVGWQAMLLGLTGGFAAGVLDLAGGLIIAHRLPAGMLAAAAAAASAGLLVSFAGAALSAVWSGRRAVVTC